MLYLQLCFEQRIKVSLLKLLEGWQDSCFPANDKELCMLEIGGKIRYYLTQLELGSRQLIQDI